MKRFFALAALLLVGLIVFAAPDSDATTTYANGTAGTDNNNQAYTPVIGTSTTANESAPTGATDGHTLVVDKSGSYARNVVVTVKAHIVVTANDAGVYDPGDTGVGGAAINTFGPAAKLKCWVLDNANGNTAWTRYPAGDQTLTAGDSTATFTVNVASMPKVRRFALVPSSANVPVKVTYSER